MTVSSRLAPHLPFLRRYARALTGDQGLGDNAVREALTALASGDLTLDMALSPRVALYRMFHARLAIPERVAVDAPDDRRDAAHPVMEAARSRLLRIAPASRQAFLLTAMEGFSASEAARIIGTPFRDIEGLIAMAQHDIDAELATGVLIIEDEPVIAADIQALVQELGHTVTGLATTRDEARRAVSQARPGLVLADIQLADGSSGIDAARDVLSDYDIPVIFITAFPERLLTGDRPEPAFLITKPFEPVTVKAAIGQALFFHPNRQPSA